MRVLVAAASVGAAIGLAACGGSSYSVDVALKNANGLRDGGQVFRGGKSIGTVHLKLAAGDRVIARLALDAGQPPIPRDSRVAIEAVNLLGRKRIDVVGGDPARPLPDGATLPAGQVMVGTDLDQVLDVLDPDTRARLAILLDETGRSVLGRREDIGQLLDALPHTLSDGTQLLSHLGADTAELDDLVRRSDRLVATLAPRRQSLGALVDGLQRLSTDLAAEHGSVTDALDAAPGALREARTLLSQLRATSQPLGPAARNIASTARQLNATLTELPGARRAAIPTLNAAAALGPDLEALAKTATPVLRGARPTIAALAGLSTDLKPVSQALSLSAADIFAIIDNWSKAVQQRDGLSHVFRGEASVAPEWLKSVLRVAPNKHQQAEHRHAQPPTTLTAPPTAAPAPTAPAPTTPTAPKQLLPPPPPQGNKQDSVSNLLDYLLGK